jgi:hypothetical protein
MAKRLAGGSASFPFSPNAETYLALAASTSLAIFDI